jgi:hypothetical protein
MTLQLSILNFLINEENFIFFFISVPCLFAVVLFGSREEKEIERGEGSPRHIIYSGDGNFSLTSFLLTTALN